jgi:hypothetical protein
VLALEETSHRIKDYRGTKYIEKSANLAKQFRTSCPADPVMSNAARSQEAEPFVSSHLPQVRMQFRSQSKCWSYSRPRIRSGCHHGMVNHHGVSIRACRRSLAVRGEWESFELLLHPPEFIWDIFGRAAIDWPEQILRFSPPGWVAGIRA